MAVPTPRTWADDEQVTPTLLNLELGTYLNFFLWHRPFFWGRNTVSVNPILTATTTVIPINAEDAKEEMTHAANDSKVYAQQPGWYNVWWGVGLALTPGTAAGGRRISMLLKNGSSIKMRSQRALIADQDMARGALRASVYLAANDYLELAVWHEAGNSRSTRVTSADSTQSYLGAVWASASAT